MFTNRRKFGMSPDSTAATFKRDAICLEEEKLSRLTFPPLGFLSDCAKKRSLSLVTNFESYDFRRTVLVYKQSSERSIPPLCPTDPPSRQKSRLLEARKRDAYEAILLSASATRRQGSIDGSTPEKKINSEKNPAASTPQDTASPFSFQQELALNRQFEASLRVYQESQPVPNLSPPTLPGLSHTRSRTPELM